MVATAQLWINGEPRPSSTDKTFDVVNGHTLEVVTRASSASIEDVYEAIEVAHKAQPEWEAVPWRTKRELFIRGAQLINTPKYADLVTEAVCQETANIESWGKAESWLASTYFMDACNAVTQLAGETMPSKDIGGTVLVERRPHGTVFAMPPVNSPFYLAARSIIVPLSFGNTVLFKPSEQSPRCAEILVQALYDAGFPKGVVNLIHVAREDAPRVVAEIIGHKLIRHINFSGSDVVGRIIAQEAAKYLKPCVLELGGKSAAIVLNDANVEEAAKAILFGGLANSGQICMSTERVIVQRGISDSLIQTLKTMVKQIHPGIDSSAKVPPLVSQSSAERVISLLKDSVERGAEMIVGDLKREGSMVKPHILLGGQQGWPAWDKESFGPMFFVKTVDTEEEAIDLANATDYTLMAAIWTRDIQKALRLGRKIRTGTELDLPSEPLTNISSGNVNINGPTFSAEFGVGLHGLGGATGYGRFDVEDFTQRHIMVIAPPNLQYPSVVNDV
ncbi:hypothetical protein Clacol_006879 [Clathrus columnatus]|uniref:Aldehyde dehydrogenase domain-containing protein n=1 Tax=Clathrus columnatus TaxID=1419009 RepID=A0AAV5AJH7_9AGAM|nr:hypothetical protein Clacol_006879 [Clathrus columnatus]